MLGNGYETYVLKAYWHFTRVGECFVHYVQFKLFCDSGNDLDGKSRSLLLCSLFDRHFGAE